MSDVFAAIADPVRREILEHLTNGEQPAGAIVEHLRLRGPITQPSVSQHLKVLRNVQLVQVRPQGRYRLYSIDLDGVVTVQHWLTSLVDPFRQSLDALDTEVARGHRRPAQATPAVPADPAATVRERGA